MKKIFIGVALLTLIVSACKKKENNPSMVVTASFPKVSIVGSPYFSIQVGGALPNITATAYDSFYAEKENVIIDQSTLDNTTPGLYSVTISAKNRYGFIGYNSVYIAVTNVSDSLNLTGYYFRSLNPSRVTFITKLARGLFMTSNVGGVDTTAATSSTLVPAIFAVTSDSTLSFGSQLTSVGTLTSSQEKLTLAPADTTLNYAISLQGFGSSVRTFTKQ